jgi:hypothetical protein
MEQSNTITTEAQKNNDIINDVINKISNNKFTIYYYCPAMNIPSGGIGVLFKQAKLLKNNGFNTVIIYEARQDTKASYVESQKKR